MLTSRCAPGPGKLCCLPAIACMPAITSLLAPAGLAGAVAGLAGAVAGLAGAVAGLAGAVAGLAGAVAGLAGAVAGLAGAVAGLAGAFIKHRAQTRAWRQQELGSWSLASHQKVTRRDPSGVCWTMDIHNHTTGDCWLKYQAGWDNIVDLKKSNLKVNHQNQFTPAFRKEHKTAPLLVPWVAGLVPQARPAP
ncbi:hypothetical protein QJQ45_011760 [Haematococcus lacustris]|nr:hypothetical protein QJQ45_011760 [Haematococcus lacustris]